MSERLGITGTSIAILETGPYWAPELSRRLLDYDCKIWEYRTFAELDKGIATLAPSLIVTCFDVNPTDCMKWMLRMSRENSCLRIPTILIVPKNLMDIEWTFREAGAVGVRSDETPGCDLARDCLRLCINPNFRP
ncbi:MAG: hypothetical protein FJ267_18950 [Planctomycetes bacterium]|nr:hypothetical protein [Planctomycetota bacterium]